MRASATTNGRTKRGLVLAMVPAVLVAAVCLAGDAGEIAAGPFPVRTWQVDEHTEGVLVRDDRAPVVYLSLEFPVGGWSRWGQEADLGSAMAIQMYDPEGELRRRSDDLAASLFSGASTRHAYVSAWCLKEDLPGLVELIRDVLANDRFDRKEPKRWKQQAKLQWKANETDVQFQGRRLVARNLYRPGDPRRRWFEEPRRVETDTEELARIRDRIARLPGRTIGLAGDLTPEEAESIAAGLLPPADPETDVDTGSALLAVVPREERADAEAGVRRLTQVYFGLGRESLGYLEDDYPAFVLANHVLGGHFYSRIMVALRHEGGETYGAFARAEGDVDPGPYIMGSFTRADNAAYAEGKLRDALATFHEDGITEDERSDAVGYLTGRLPFARAAPYQVLSRFLEERRLGLPQGFFDRLPERAAALTLDEINAFIATYYDPDAFVMGRVAPQ